MAKAPPPKISLPPGLMQFAAQSLPPAAAGSEPVPVDAQIEGTYDAYMGAIGHTVPWNVNRVQAVIGRLPGIVG